MSNYSPTRDLRFAVALAMILACGGAGFAQRRDGGGPGVRGQAFHQGASRGFRQPAQARMGQGPERRAPSGPQSQLAPIVRRNPQAQGARGEHLAEWMNQHRNLTPQQQQQALDHEPGFRELPQQTQQRMHNQLTRLNAMSPEQRQRILNHNEWMEHLSLDQRAVVRGSMQQLGLLPPDQRREVARSFRDLRQLPPDQRGAALNSPQYQYMNPAQRSALNNLLRIEPLIPPD